MARQIPPIDMRDYEGRAGLRQRLAEKRQAAIGKSVVLPLCSFPQLPDKPKNQRRSNA